jgi:hypothetical protein
MASDIKLQVSGRLGNQLFQWSYAHYLSYKFGVPVQPVIDSKHFEEKQPSIFTDSIFSCIHVLPQKRNESIGNMLVFLDKMNSLLPSMSGPLERRLRISRQKDAYILNDQPFHPRLVTGFFIDSSHVADNAPHLMHHLNKKFEKERVESKIHSISNGQSFQAVHIRRGDFIPLKETFGLLDSSWYLSNLDPALPLVLATDDIEGSSELIKELKPKIILNPGDWTEWETLGILSRAKRLITANSTFSWWAGFCSVQNGNTCIVPKPFYKSEPWKDSHLVLKGFLQRKSIFEV